jgi:hypothetical protein
LDLSVNSSEIYGKSRAIGPSPILFLLVMSLLLHRSRNKFDQQSHHRLIYQIPRCIPQILSISCSN